MSEINDSCDVKSADVQEGLVPDETKANDVQEDATSQEAVDQGQTKEEEVEYDPEKVVLPAFNFMDKSISELSALFEELAKAEDRMKRYKEADAIKSAFYRKIGKARLELGESEENPFEAVEEAFKAFYNAYKKERLEYLAEMERASEENLRLKNLVIEDLKALIAKQEDTAVTYPAFKQIQARWKEIGPVPAKDFRTVNQNYQLYVEQFYDIAKINRELRDLDFKKNLEAKEKLCKEAETLAEKDDVVSAFKELQKLHDQWKEYGPVEKELRESIWERFKEATSVINKKYQAHFESLKEGFEKALAAKTALCERVEAMLESEIKTSRQWNDLSKEIEAIQKEWKEAGTVARKDNAKIYERFRSACDKFFDAKKAFYDSFKQSMNENLARKEEICAKAEELKSSTEWKKTADELIELQKQWKEIGAVPRKKADELWTRFRGACDEFFAAKQASAKAARNKFSDRFSRKDDGRSEKDKLVALFRKKEQEIETFENNLGFFAKSKNAEALVSQMRKKIDDAKAELKALEDKIREISAREKQN